MKKGALTGFLLAAATAFSQGQFVQVASLNTPRQETGAAKVGGFVYVCGGLDAGFSALRSVERYDIANDRWEFVADMPVARDHMGVASVADRVYVCGGYAGDFSAKRETYEYDPAANQWTRKADMPETRGAPWAVAVNSKIYVFGGANALGGATRTVFIYETSTNTWTRGADMPTTREHLTATRYGTDIYVIGGRAGGASTNANEKYDALTNAWQMRTPMPSARAAPSNAAFAGRIYVMGGETPRLFEVNEVYDPATNLWTVATPMAVPRHGLPGIPLSNGILLPGGGTVEGLAPTSYCDIFVTGQHVVPPSAFSLFRGVLVSGVLSDLFESDEFRLVARPGVVLQSGEAPVQVVLEGVSPDASPTELRYTLEASASIPNISQRIAMFNYVSSAYEEMDFRLATTFDSVVEVVIVLNASRFVEPGTLALKAKLSYKEAGPVFSYPWLARIDQAVWTVTP